MSSLKRILSLVVVFAMLLSVSVFADGPETPDEGEPAAVETASETAATVDLPAADAAIETAAEAVETANEVLETLEAIAPETTEETDTSGEAIEAAAEAGDLDALAAIVEAAAESAKADAGTAKAAAETTQTAADALQEQVETGTFEYISDETVFEAVDEESGEVYETTTGQVLVETAQAAANAATAAAQNAETASENAANAADAAQYALENSDEPATEEQQQIVDTAKAAAADAAEKSETAKAAAAEVEAVIETATATAEEAAEIVAKAADAAKDAAVAANNAAVAAKDAADTIAVLKTADEHTEDEVSEARATVVEKVEKAVELAKVADKKAELAKEAAARAKDVTLSGEEKAQAIAEAAKAAKEATIAANEAADAANEAADAAWELAEQKGWPFYGKVVTAKGVIVTARAQAGVFPKGTELTAEDVEAEQVEEQMDVAASDVVTAVDINFWLGEAKIQPDTSKGLVDVTITDPNAEVPEDAKLEVATVKDGETEIIVPEVDAEGVVAFSAEHFTVYTVVNSNETVVKITTSETGENKTTTATDLLAAITELGNSARNITKIELLKDVELTGNLNLDLNGSAELDLGNHTLYGRTNLTRGSLTITNGNIKSSKDITASDEVQPLNVYGSDTSAENYSVLTISQGVTVSGGEFAVCMFGRTYRDNGYGAVINIAGNINSIGNGKEGTVFVSGNLGKNVEGDAKNVINITGTVTSTSDAAIALNGLATVNVNRGAVISGNTAIAVKRGTLNVNEGAQVSADGTKYEPPAANNNGTEMTGAAVSVTNTYNGNGPLAVNIYGGTLTSANGYAVYKQNASYTNDATVNITGGTFSSNPSGYLADGYKIQDGTSYTVVPDMDQVVAKVEETGIYYTTLQKAVDAIGRGTSASKYATGTIELLKNITLAERVHVPNVGTDPANAYVAITINGGDHTISGDLGTLGSFFTGFGENELRENTSLTVNHTKFVNTNAERGKQVIVTEGQGTPTNNQHIALSYCSFTNMYCAVYVNPGTSASSFENRSLSITNCTYTDVSYGYCVDTSCGYLSNDWDGTAAISLDRQITVTFTDNTGYGQERQVFETAQVGDYVYTTLQAAINAAPTNGSPTVVKLLKNAQGDGVNVAGERNVELDFQGFTYTVSGATVGSTGTVTQGFRVLKGSTATLKNGTLAAGAATANLYQLVHTYGTVTFDNFNVDASANSLTKIAIEPDAGTMTFKNASNITAYSGTDALVVDYWASSYPEGVAVYFDETYTGTVTGKLAYGSEDAGALTTETLNKCVLEIHGNGTFNTGAFTKGPTNWWTSDHTVSNIKIYGGTFGSNVDSYTDSTHSAYQVVGDNTHWIVLPTSGYTVTWKDDNSSTIDTTTVAYGATPTHGNPTKASTAQYTYTFNGWSPEIAVVTGDATYTATYTSTVRSYTVTFQNWDSTVIGTQTVDYGNTPTAPSATPTRPDSGNYYYSFSGWGTLAPVTGDVTYTAQFNQYEYTYDDSSDDTPAAAPAQQPQETLTIEEEATPLAALPESLSEVLVAVINEAGETVEVAVSELPNVYADVEDDSWSRDAIAYANALGLMNGVGADENGEASFNPQGTTTSEMLTTVLYRATSGETTSGENWAEDAIAWAEEANLTEGLGLVEGEAVTREQMVTMMYRVAEARGFDVAATTDLTGYTDADKMSEFARAAMEWAVSVGLINGTDVDKLSPDAEVTREQIATILMRFNEMTKDVI